MSEEGKPGRAVGAARRSTMFGEYTSHNILVNLDTEHESDLLSDAPAAKARVPPFHFDDRCDQFWARPFRARFPSLPGSSSLAAVAMRWMARMARSRIQQCYRSGSASQDLDCCGTYAINSNSPHTGDKAHRMRNNIGYPNNNRNMQGVQSSFNTWDLGLTPAGNDFESLSDSGFMGPRNADGSLPNLNFLKLRAGSQMIDRGTNVGLPYSGAAPDLGAYER